jgi:hypothetical protein
MTPQINRGNALGAKVIRYLPLSPNYPQSTGGEAVTLSSGQYVTAGQYAMSPPDLSLGASGSGGASTAINLSAYSAISIACSFFWPSYANNDALLAEYTTNYFSAGPAGFIIDPNSSDTNFDVGVSGTAGSASTYSFPRPSAGVWHRLMMTADLQSVPNFKAAYIDGIKQVLTPVVEYGSTGLFFGNSTLYLLSRANASLFATGDLQDFTIYKGVLTDAEAANDARKPRQILLAPARRRSVFVPSAGTFQPAWAARANYQIDAGVMA